MVIWNNSFACGIPKLDKQHRRLFEIMTELDPKTCNATNVHKIFEDLKKYAQFHFKSEEDLMDLYGIPDIVHTREHLEFSNQILSFADKVYAEDMSVVPGMSSYLKRWLLKHIMWTDKEMSKRILEIKAAGGDRRQNSDRRVSED